MSVDQGRSKKTVGEIFIIISRIKEIDTQN